MLTGSELTSVSSSSESLSGFRFVPESEDVADDDFVTCGSCANVNPY
jgi:hypothetical protein